MSIRARYAFVPHTLTADPNAEDAIFEAECTTCSDRSQPSGEDREPVELWALSHTGRTGHTGYREIITRFWRALPTP
ncbi:DUF7848 domain-containing protein [Streptomyces sp. 8N616]|uniref:DUF7848 domain-containing protein n=1 Tax=Streptomyces sp. 8N616 TaxID=3457414 RepID=UPI003FCFD37B